MAIGNRLLVVIDADVKGAIRELDKLGTKAEGSLSGTDAKIDRFANGAIKFGAAVSAGAAVAGVGLYKAAQQASDLNESVTKSEVVFGRQGQAVVKWAGTLADSFGLSKREALAAAGGFGSMFRTTGLAGGEAAKMSKRMTELAGDMASFNNEDPSDMLDRLRSGLAGEAEPLRRFGVLLSEARVQSFAYANGIAKAGEKLTESQKVQARYGLILKDTKLQQGDFARTADGAANSQRAFKAQIDNLVTSLGQGALPVLKNVTGALADVAGKANEFDQASGGLIGKIGTIGVGVAGAVGGISLLAGTVAKMNTAFSEGGPLAGRWGTAVKGLAAVGAVLAAVSVIDQLTQAIRHVPSETERAAAAAKAPTQKLVEEYKKLGQLSRFSRLEVGNRGGLKEAATDLTRFRALAENSLGTAERLYTALRKPGSGAEESGIKLGKYKDILDKARASQGQAASDAERGASATDRHARATEGDTAAIQKNNDALDARRTALLASFSSEVASAQSTAALAETLKTTQDPLERNAALLSAAGDRAQAMSDQLAAAGVNVDDASVKQGIFKQALIDLGTQFPELRGLVDGYIARLDAIPPNKNTTVTANVDPAVASLNVLAGKLGAIATLYGLKAFGVFGNPDGRAAGGPVKSGTPYVVGEKGPELFVPNGSGRIINARDSAAKLSAVGSGGGGDVYNIYWQSPGEPTAEDGRRFVQGIRAYERNSGKAWRNN